MKTKHIFLGSIFIVALAIGGMFFYFLKREDHLFDLEGGVCPRCMSHDVRRWAYGLGVENTDEVCAGGCVVSQNFPKYHCDLYGFDWGVYEVH